MNGLVLAGGGARGAYQVGVLRYLLKDLKIHFNIISGVSVGALNAAAIAQFNQGQEVQAYEFLENIWLNIRDRHVYRHHYPFGPMHFPFRGSIYSTKPLQKTIAKYMCGDKLRTSDKKLIVSATNYRTGRLMEFDGQSPNILSAILASAAIPVLFPPIKLADGYYLDGGVQEIVPANAVKVRGCKNIISIVPTPEYSTVEEPVGRPTIREVITRTVDLAVGDINEGDLRDHLVIRPELTLTENAIDFSPKLIKEMMELGYRDAKEQYTWQHNQILRHQ